MSFVVSVKWGVYILFVAAIFVVYRLVVAKWVSPLRHIPGPLLARMTGKRLEVYTVIGKMACIGRKDYEAYGDIYVCAPNAVSITNPADIRMLLNNPLVPKAPYYRILRFTGIDNTVSTQDMELANSRRRQMGPYFNPTYLAKMEQTIMQRGILSIKHKWDQLIERSMDGAAEVNYSHDFLFASFDTIGTLIFGRQIKELRTNDVATAHWIDTTVTYIGVRSMLQLFPQIKIPLFEFPWERRYTTLSTYIDVSIDQRRQHLAELASTGREDKRPTDLLQAFIDAEDPESKVQMTHAQIHGECMLMMLAGADTVAHTISWAVHFLTLHPKFYARAVSEVRSAFDSGHTISYSECRAKLPFVEACLYESLRLAPVTGGMLPRVSPAGGLMIQGHFVPEGTFVFVNFASSNHHKKTWCRPYEFDPTRFLDDSEARHNVFTFSSGKRICPGRHLAWWEMLTVFANILKDYDWRLPADFTHLGPNILDEHGYPKQMESQQFIVVKPANAERDCRLIITKRQ
ncbi:cytochrome P450 [Kickxella alabastrina]|uniref:cytochrome P450 n=1 Tax=Kickxella alabastrina TaxID=61397 RepID=UPI00221FFC7B|nr:cytochrome P450 [Kickxella alabastrina]KAI7831906.1 cytochrome P450 [Kickxella alabastrina]